MKSKSGFTVLELMIAASLLALVLVGATSVFRGGSDSFRTGTWRAQSQKRAQVFLSVLREFLEKANDSETISADGVVTPTTIHPVFVNRRWYNTTGTCAGVNDSCMYFNINKPFVGAPSALLRSNTGAGADTNGTWSGVALYCLNGTLHIKRSGQYSAINSNPFPAQFAPPSANFSPAPGVEFHTMLENVASMTIQETRTTSGVSLLVRLTLQAPRDKRNITLSEEVRAKLLRANHPVTSY